MTAGTVLGDRYELVRQLGAGGFGSVWRARDTRLLREVAVKLVEMDADTDPDTRERATVRFHREAQAVAGLNHPNVVIAHDFGVSRDTAYLVMELIEGRSLAQIVRDRYTAGEGPLDVPTVLRIADNVCAGLGAAHRAGLVHRDLKPANLMVVPVEGEPVGQVKIVDFGIARVTDRSKLTRTGSYMGTLPYIAPEQMTSKTLDGRADIYALGCLLHELLTGRSAFDADTPVQWLAAHQYSTPFALTDHLPDAPPALEALLRDMLAKDPADRPRDVDEVRRRIAAISRELAAASVPTPPPARPPGMSATLVEGIQVPPNPVAAPPEAPTPPPVTPPIGPPPPVTPPPVAPPIGPPAIGVPPIDPRPVSRRTTVTVLSVAIALAVVAAFLALGPLGLLKTGGGNRHGPLAGASSGPPASPSHPVVVRTTPECTLKIAYVGTLHSTFSERDQAEYQGMQLALAQYDQAHPDCPVTPEMFDTNPANLTTPGPAVAAAAARAGQDPHVVAAFGPSSSTDSPAVLGELDKAGVPEVSASANNDNLATRNLKVFHRATANRGIVFNAMATWIAGQAGAKAYVIDDTSQFGRYMATTLKTRLKTTVVGSEEVLNEGKQTVFTDTVGRVLASGANIVAYGGTMTNAGHLVNQLRAGGYTGLFLIHDLAYQPPFAGLAGSALAGVKVFCGCTYSLADGSDAFNSAYKAKFGADPALFANIAYDMTNMMLKGIDEGATTREALNAWLGTNSYTGLASSYKFAADGELDPSVAHVNVFTVGEPGEQNVPIAQG